MNFKNYYNILGLDSSASQEEIRQVFRKLSKKFHPDKNNNDEFFEEMFKNINEAKEILANPAKRREYDNYLEKSSSSEIVQIHRETLLKTNELIKQYFEKEREVIYKQKRLLELQHAEKPRYFTMQKLFGTLLIMLFIFLFINPNSEALPLYRNSETSFSLDSNKNNKKVGDYQDSEIRPTATLSENDNLNSKSIQSFN